MKRRFYRESRTSTKPLLLGITIELPKTETSHHHGWKESNFAAALRITTSQSTVDGRAAIEAGSSLCPFFFFHLPFLYIYVFMVEAQSR